MKKRLFIGGEWVEGSSYYDLKSPYNGELLAQIPLATTSEVKAALDQAEKAFQVIRQMTSLERATILEKASQLFQDRLEECAQILAKENAKPIKTARTEISRTIETYKFAAEEAKRIHGETIPMDAAINGKDRFAFTIREPLGIIAAITPFNFPFNLVAHKLGPAIAVGNSVVLKPANQTPLSALMTAEIFAEAGLPAGGLNVVTGRGSEIGDVLIGDSRVKMITFTGSVEVGLGIREKAGLKKVTLELGSNSAVIVDSVNDLDEVAARCVEGSFAFSGQVCISVQRIYVNRQLYDSFLEHFIEKTKSLVIGDPQDEGTNLSAMISPAEAERVENWLNEARNSTANIVYGGNREGGILHPTVITEVKPTMAISCKEAFAPIVSIVPYDSFDQAIEYVNDSDYGLQAGVYTTSIGQAFDAIRKIEVGGVIINDIPSFRVDQMPYGGVKNSGTGREGVKYSVEEMTELKLVSFKL
ncbi:aldehyde dehydrogenase family protein [Ammoniphilus resinae]|uniref:Acyl-CoA reductase-like NAD-dependent aldehyde dehydrogenase n=1 Tax=Ammoniphilus resinae TaxID=861532 RepID=A0ABS4GNW4_9BACL|nr:aldehyde dehydrogenase family protein [Ammoniphilus resinae]MBP1931921.1 acyl-CoA reductase-like NAD-dependent aldehyde dehydrogenase [Ammoniphilus resinae]